MLLFPLSLYNDLSNDCDNRDGYHNNYWNAEGQELMVSQ